MSFDQKRNRGEYHVPKDDSLSAINKQRSFVTIFFVVVVVGVGGWLAINFSRATYKDPQDVQMLKQARIINSAVARYHLDNAEYPSSLDYVVQYFPKDKEWPVVPYNGLDLHDTGSPEFSGPDSVGMVHYEKLDVEGKTGYRLYVFGREAVLKVMWGGYSVDH